MIALLSPAKSLELERPYPAQTPTQPAFLPEAERIVTSVRRLSKRKFAASMDLSAALTELNLERYRVWEPPFTEANARPALYTFNGDVYEGLDAWTLEAEAVAFAQRSLRILSGLYGVLRPLDLMQPYRLEMGARYQPPRASSLPAFWKKRLTDHLRREVEEEGHTAVVNLASQEYAAAVDFRRLRVPVIDVQFLEERDGERKTISFFAKKARGLMARYVVSERLESPEGLREFAGEGYRFQPELSREGQLVFVR